jgi:hypothetical protein
MNKVDVLIKAETIPNLAYNWQLLINELRLLDYRVGVAGSLYYSADVEDEPCEAKLIIGLVDPGQDGIILCHENCGEACKIKAKANYQVFVKRAVEIGSIVELTHKYLQRYVCQDRDFDYTLEEATHLWATKHVSLLRAKLHTEAPIIVIKGHSRILVMQESGNEVVAIPSVGTMVISLSKAIKEVAADGQLAPTEQADARIASCEACDYFIPKTRRCVDCGCYLDAKTKILNAKCPRGYW